MIKNHLLAGAAFLALASSQAFGQVKLNEIYVSMTGADTTEFIELKGPAGTSLAGYMVLIVDSDAGTQLGKLDYLYDLSSYSIGTSGYFVLGDAAVLPAPDLVMGTQDKLENGANTFYLVTTSNVAAITALLNTTVATGPNVTSIPTLATIVDAVAVIDLPPSVAPFDEPYDGAAVVGPDGTFLAPGAVRCGDAPFGWNPQLLDFDNILTTGYILPTPGAANPNCSLAVGTSFCPGDGTGTACPCANSSVVGAGEGCLNSLGLGARMSAGGSASISADTVILTGVQMPNSSALYFQGTSQASAGAGTVFGDGLRCAGGSVIRLGTKQNAAGTSQYPAVGDPSITTKGLVVAPGTRTYQIWYRNAAAFCTASTFNLSNGLEVSWAP